MEFGTIEREIYVEASPQTVFEVVSSPDHLIFVCPHHDIGEATDVTADQRMERRAAEYLHHGDRVVRPVRALAASQGRYSQVLA